MKMKRLSHIFQIGFWLLVMALQMAMAGDFHSFAVVPLFAGLSMILCMVLFYMNTLWLFPRLFELQRFGLYLLINLLALIIISQLFFTVEDLIVKNFRSDVLYENMPPFYPYFRIVILLVFVYFISLAFSLIRKVKVQDTTVKQLLLEKEERPQLKGDHLIIRADRKLYKINYEDLLYIEGQKAYVTFHTKKKNITALASLRDLEEQLPSSQFLRIHKSFIVSIHEIESLEGNRVEIGGIHLSVGKSYRPDVARVFGIK
jgi:hypothetical protein